MASGMDGLRYSPIASERWTYLMAVSEFIAQYD